MTYLLMHINPSSMVKYLKATSIKLKHQRNAWRKPKETDSILDSTHNGNPRTLTMFVVAGENWY